VGRQDNFFELGGHSLLAMRVIARLRQALHVSVTITDIFAHPVLADLAEEVVTAQLENYDMAAILDVLKAWETS